MDGIIQRFPKPRVRAQFARQSVGLTSTVSDLGGSTCSRSWHDRTRGGCIAGRSF